MKVLRQGIIPGDIKHYAVCNHCKSVLEFQRKEAKMTHDQREGDYMVINCPVCATRVTVDVKSSMTNPLDNARYTPSCM